MIHGSPSGFSMHGLGILGVVCFTMEYLVVVMILLDFGEESRESVVLE